MTVAELKINSHQRWTLEDIPWHTIQSDAMVNQEELFNILVAASFIEITTDLFTRNLLEYFSDDKEVTLWLEQHWEHEELLHGYSLKRYVQTVWPEFDWERTYQAFLSEYSNYCRLDLLEPTRSMEMAARCVVEMGTASYYTALSRLSPDPVLSMLAHHIREDEVRHYKHFYHYFLRYRQCEGTSRTSVLKALWHRLKMIDGEDGLIAIKHVYLARHPGHQFDKHVYRDLRKRYQHKVRRHIPLEMSIKMLIKPLGLSPRVQHAAVPILAGLARHTVV